MDDLIRSGLIADIILLALAAEVAAAGYLAWRGWHRRQLLSVIANSLAGAALVLALRAALQDQAALFVAIWLIAALLAHVADIALRLFATRQAAGVSSRK